VTVELGGAKTQQRQQMRGRAERIGERLATAERQRSHDGAVHLGEHEAPARGGPALEHGEALERCVVVDGAEAQRHVLVVDRGGLRGPGQQERAADIELQLVRPLVEQIGSELRMHHVSLSLALILHNL